MTVDWRIVKAVFFLPFTAAIGAVIGPMISLPVVGYEMLADIEVETYSGPAWYVGLVLGIPFFAWLGWKTIYQRRPEDQRFTIFGTARWANAGVIQTFGVNDYETAEWLSKTMGQETVEYATTSQGRTHSGFIDGSTTRGVSQQFTGRSLLNPDEVMRIAESQQILLVKGMPPVSAEKLRYFADREFNGLYDAP